MRLHNREPKDPKKGTTRPRRYLYLSAPVGETTTTDPLHLPSHVLIGQNREYFWEGVGPLPLKMFHHGKARYRVGSRGHCAVDETTYLLLNHQQHYSISIDAPEPVQSFCLFFAEGYAEEVRRSLTLEDRVLLEEPDVTLGTLDFYERTYSHDDSLTPRLVALQSALLALGGDELCPVWLSEQMRQIMCGLLAQQGVARQEPLRLLSAAILRPTTREELYRRLHVARDYIIAYFDAPITLEEMAAVACLSPNHFLRTFKALFRQTPHQYLTARRLNEARRLLTHTELPVTLICLQVGFQSLGSFSHLFTRHVGISPEIYRYQESAISKRFR